MAQHKNDFTDTTASAVVHAAAHNDVATSLTSLEQTVASLQSQPTAAAPPQFVDITIPIAGAILDHRINGAFPGWGFYAPRQFRLTYLHIFAEKGPTGGQVLWKLLDNSSQVGSVIVPAASSTFQAQGSCDTSHVFTNWVDRAIQISYDPALTDLGRDVVIRLGGSTDIFGTYVDPAAISD